MTATQASPEVVSALTAIVRAVTELDHIDPDTPLLQLGATSLMLMQIRGSVRARFDVDLPMSRFFAEDGSIHGLAGVIAAERGEPLAPASTPAPVASAAPITAANASAEVVQLLAEQVRVFEQLTRQQLATLQALGRVEAAGPSARRAEPVVAATPEPARAREDVFVPYKPIVREPSPAAAQGDPDRLAALISAYCEQTPSSKRRTDADRPVFANNRNVAGFNPAWKEMVYQIIGTRARGSKIWDLDDNEYVDLTMGFGAALFGHNAPFLVEAIERQLARSYAVGPISEQAGAVARLLCELTGFDRAAFFNSGTEAVMVALRLARTATGRDKIVVFQGSYHGSFDGVLAVALPGVGEGRGAPMAPGIPASAIADTFVLRYDDPASLEFIRAHGHELAAVLVEPVQSRRPDQQPRAFLHELRAITREVGAALIFDEVVTGFRIGPGGAQEHFDVRADIATYGKVVGGGMPVGIVAGRERFMAGIDGGLWRYGDASRPSSTNTFVAGTFCSHPLAMATTFAVLERIADEGAALFGELDRKTARLCAALDRVFAEREIDVRMVRFGSLFRFVVRGDQELLYYKLLSKGVYVWEGRNCFLSTAHDDEDLARVIDAVTAAADELLARPKPGSRASTLLPATFEQARMFARCELPGGNRSYNTIAGYTIDGPLDVERLAAALQGLVDRHESLRTGFERGADGAVVQRIHARAEPQLLVRELDEAALPAFERELLEPMALTGPSLVRAGVARLGPQRHVLMLAVHHLVTDGLSIDLMIDELVRRYDGEALAPVTRQFREFVAWEQAYLDSARARRDRAFWLAQLDGAEALDLPTDGPRGPRSFAARGLFVTLEPTLVAGLRGLAQAHGATLNMLMLSVYAVLLAQISGRRSFCVGGPCAGRPDGLFDEAIGMFMGAIGYRVSPTPDKSFSELLGEVRRFCIDAYDAQHYPFPLVAEALGLDEQARRSLYQVGFSFEEYTLELPQARELTIGRYPIDKRMLAVDLILRCLSEPGPLTLHFAANAALFGERTLQRWADAYLRLCAQVLADPTASLATLLEPPVAPAPGLAALG